MLLYDYDISTLNDVSLRAAGSFDFQGKVDVGNLQKKKSSLCPYGAEKRTLLIT